MSIKVAAVRDDNKNQQLASVSLLLIINWVYEQLFSACA